MTESERKLERLGAKLDPGLKSWIDHVIVPGMVRLYQERRLSSGKSAAVAHSGDELSAEVSR